MAVKELKQKLEMFSDDLEIGFVMDSSDPEERREIIPIDKVHAEGNWHVVLVSELLKY